MDIVTTDASTKPKRVTFSDIAIGSMFIFEGNGVQYEGYYTKVAHDKANALGYASRIRVFNAGCKCIPLYMQHIEPWTIDPAYNNGADIYGNANVIPKEDD